MRKIVSLLLTMTLPLQALAAEFEIFTLNELAVDQANVAVYQVNQGDTLLQEVNRTLASAGITDEDQAKPYVTDELTQALSEQVTGLVKAAHYQLRYFPAIVVDGRFVIYGTTDISVYERLKP